MAEELCMENRIVIRSAEPQLREHLFSDDERSELTLDEGTETAIALQSSRRFRTGEFADVMQIAVQWGGPVGAGIVTQWLYDRLRGKKIAILIGGRPIEPTKEEIYHALTANDDARAQQLTQWIGADRAILAIVFTDVVDSTLLGGRLGEETMFKVWGAHFGRSRQLIADHRGYPVKSLGDGDMALFKTVDVALDYALAVQANPGHPELRVRAGIHIGPVQVLAHDIGGREISFAARVIGANKGAEIWLSNEAKRHIDLLNSARHKDIYWVKHPNMELKGFDGTFTLWALAGRQTGDIIELNRT
jgi:class 3 adenylate cyclase